MLSLSNTSLPATFTLVWRLSLAIGGGFILTSLFCVWLPQLLHTVFSVQITPIFIWCQLGGFALYCTLIMWLVSTVKLARASLIVCLVGVLLFFTISPVGVTS